MCMKTVYANLEQLRWELVAQESELTGQKLSPEILETIAVRAKENGVILPRIRLERPDDMNDEDYGEATEIFKNFMIHKRQQQITALEIVADLLEDEVFYQPETILTVNAKQILSAGQDCEEEEEL